MPIPNGLPVAMSLLASAALLTPAHAQTPVRPGFHPGSVITGFGPVASVETSAPLPADAPRVSLPRATTR